MHKFLLIHSFYFSVSSRLSLSVSLFFPRFPPFLYPRSPFFRHFLPFLFPLLLLPALIFPLLPHSSFSSPSPFLLILSPNPFLFLPSFIHDFLHSRFPYSFIHSSLHPSLLPSFPPSLRPSLLPSYLPTLFPSLPPTSLLSYPPSLLPSFLRKDHHEPRRVRPRRSLAGSSFNLRLEINPAT